MRKPENTTVIKGGKLKGSFNESSKEKGCKIKFFTCQTCPMGKVSFIIKHL